MTGVDPAFCGILGVGGQGFEGGFVHPTNLVLRLQDISQREFAP
jgi:hypothetical protein